MKFAMKVAYFGPDFFGSQKQPDKRTVQGELEKFVGSVKPASRTDRGVSALGAVFTFEAKQPPNLNRLNQVLPDDVIVLDIKPVPDDFNPRHAKMKHYRYFLPTGQDIRKIESNIKNLKVTDKTRLIKIEVHESKDSTHLDFWGEYFDYKAIRKLIGQILGTNRAADAGGLILMKIEYPDLTLENKVNKKFLYKFNKKWSKYFQLSRVLETLLFP